jgi:hypothetical protein
MPEESTGQVVEASQKVRAKFAVGMVGKTSWGAQEVRANAVYGGQAGSENASFAAATPSGTFELTVDNPAVQDFFEPGAEYYVTFERATT